MALEDYSLITVAELGDYAKISTTEQTTYQSQLEAILNGTADLMEDFCRRRLKQHGTDTAITEYHDGKGPGHFKLFPRHFPIGAVTSIHVDQDQTFGASDLVDSGDYFIDDEYGWIELFPTANISAGFSVGQRPYFAKGVHNIKLIYTAGFGATGAPSVPYDLKEAAKIIAANALRDSFHALGKGTLRHRSISRGEETVNLVPPTSIPDQARTILERYQRVQVL